MTSCIGLIRDICCISLFAIAELTLRLTCIIQSPSLLRETRAPIDEVGLVCGPIRVVLADIHSIDALSSLLAKEV